MNNVISTPALATNIFFEVFYVWEGMAGYSTRPTINGEVMPGTGYRIEFADGRKSYDVAPVLADIVKCLESAKLGDKVTLPLHIGNGAHKDGETIYSRTPQGWEEYTVWF